VSAVRRDTAVRIAVRDRGPGIPESFRPRIFDKFAQAEFTESQHRGGTGLGLSISKAIVEGLGGRIGFDSQVSDGATFWIDLPLREDERSPRAERPEPVLRARRGDVTPVLVRSAARVEKPGDVEHRD
jgi:signal transduction histidine kinase